MMTTAKEKQRVRRTKLKAEREEWLAAVHKCPDCGRALTKDYDAFAKSCWPVHVRFERLRCPSWSRGWNRIEHKSIN